MGLSMYIGLCCLGSLITNPFLGAKAASCPRNWLQKQGNCYGYFDEKLSWDDAEVRTMSPDVVKNFLRNQNCTIGDVECLKSGMIPFMNYFLVLPLFLV
uniref:Uncharacterized protein n=1 Tax=Laticauda laticaudata TaxID=8630 RepID=A0A8C5WVI7_LATLA